MEEQKAINEEFKIWKKNTPFLYDFLLIHALEWPSLTCQWLPEHSSSTSSSSSSSAQSSDDGDDYEVHRLLLGTHTTDGEGNFLLVAETRLPTSSSALSSSASSARPGGYGAAFGALEIVQAINHTGEVNRARYMPGNSSIIASKTTNAEVWLFDRTAHVAKANRASQCRPDYRLTGHEKEGYGLSWSALREGHLLSGSEDGLVCLWDVAGSVGKKGADGVSIPALATFRGHSLHVEDVAWHCSNPALFASASDDRHLLLWDTRTKPSQPAQSTSPHTGEINCLAFSPFTPHLLLTGSADQSLALLDARQLSSKLHSFEQHTDQVFTVAWSPHAASVFASGSGDRRVNVWDVSRIGLEQSPEDAEDGPAELMFVHGGHTDKVGDVSWLGEGGKGGGGEEWVVASVADDNIVQVWSMAESIYQDDDDDDEKRKIADDQLE